MATFCKPGKHAKEKPWRAKAYRDKTYYHIGYYKTKEEAVAAEIGFAVAIPPLTTR